jgi:hypothetical protein
MTVGSIAEVQQLLHLATKQAGKEAPLFNRHEAPRFIVAKQVTDGVLIGPGLHLDA